MTIGMFECDGEVEACESAKRAVRETAKLLTDRGHKVRVLDITDMLCIILYRSLLCCLKQNIGII